MNRLYFSRNRFGGDHALVTPEPPADEREALLAALAEARAEEQRGLDPWTAEALREAADVDG